MLLIKYFMTYIRLYGNNLTKGIINLAYSPIHSGRVLSYQKWCFVSVSCEKIIVKIEWYNEFKTIFESDNDCGRETS